MIKQNNIYNNIVEYFFVIVTILSSNIMLNYQTGKDQSFGLLITFVWNLSLLLLFLSKNFYLRIPNTLKILIFLGSMMMFIFLVFNFLYYDIISFPYLLRLILLKIIDPILLIIYFSSMLFSNRKINFFKNYVQIISILSYVSLLFWIINLLKVPFTGYISISKWFSGVVNVPHYFFIDFFPEGIRNCGIFTEPSMFAYVLIIALFIELFLNKKNVILKNNKVSKYNILLLYLTILTTESTTSIVIGLIAILYYLYINNYLKWTLLFVLFPSIYYLNSIITNKISHTSMYDSFGIRSDDIVACFNAWKLHPFFGNGLANTSLLVNEFINPNRILIGYTGITTGMMQVMAYGGLFYLLYYLAPTILAMFVSKKIGALALLSFVLCVFVTAQDYYLYEILLSYFIAYFYFYHSNKSLV